MAFVDYQSNITSLLFMNDTGNSFGSNPASLKGKLQTLEVLTPPFRHKSKTSPMNSTTIKRKCRSSEARRTL
jgi:hypothetical protein